MMDKCSPITECMACGSPDLVSVLDLGEQPLANSYKINRNDEEELFPLTVNRCKHCYHVQIGHRVNPDLLFKNYLYVSGTSNTMKDFFRWFAGYTLEQQPTAETVLDIGCNDGSQLDAYRLHGRMTYGVDPATNLHPISTSKGHNVLCGYFNDDAFEDKTFDIIVCQNAFPHNYDQLGFLKTVKKHMHDDTRLYIATSQGDMIINNEFDTIYHEHISFYNIKSMDMICKRAGLNLIDVCKNPVHGNSYIFTISLSEARPYHIENLIALERRQGLYTPDTYEAYSKKCLAVLEQFQNYVANIRKQGYTVVGYGAAAKGTTILNAANCELDFIIDDNPLKQGKYIPGMGIPITSIDALKIYDSKEPLFFVPLAWNFYDEIKGRIKSVRGDKKDVYIRYFPTLTVETEGEIMQEATKLTLVDNEYDLEAARRIRNVCKDFMTRNNNYITEEEQKNWFSTLDKTKLRLYTFNKIYDGVNVPIGYGVIRVEDSAILVTGGLIESERGKGYGLELFKCLIEESKKDSALPIKLEVLKSNAPGIATYKKLGFKPIGEDERIIRMEYRK